MAGELCLEQERSLGWFPQGEDVLCCSSEACATAVSRESLSRRSRALQQQIEKALDLLRDRKAGKAQLASLRSAAPEDVALAMRWHCCFRSRGPLACSLMFLGT